MVFSRPVRSRLKYPSSISTSLGSATAASVETNGRYAQADAGISRAAKSAARILIRHGLEDEHLRCGPTFFLFRGCVHAVRPWVDGEAVNLRLDGDVLQLSEVRRVVHLEYRDDPARAGDVDPAKSGVVHHDVGTFRHREVRDGPVRVEIEDRHGVVAFT